MNIQSTFAKNKHSIDSHPPTDLIEKILANTNRVAMLPDIAVRALEMVKDLETTIQAFADLIQQDFKLATDVLSMANSVMYSTGPTTASLPQAISRLGFEQCKNLIIASSIGSAMNEMDLNEEWTREVLWKHSVTTGMIAGVLNRNMRLGFAGEEFAAGLVHDFGRLLLASVFPDQFSTFDSLDFNESLDSLEQENQSIGCNHCDIGAWFAASQGLPEVLCEVIRFHHAPEQSSKFLRLVALTATADHMANHYHRFGEIEEYDPETNTSVHFLEQSGVKNACKEFLRVALDAMATGVNEANEVISN